MSVLIETSVGDIIVDLYIDYAPIACRNFLKLCKMKYYNFSLFHSIKKNFIAQAGAPSDTSDGGQSIFGLVSDGKQRFFHDEISPFLKHTKRGILSMASGGQNLNGSQFFFTLGDNLDFLDGKYTIFGEIAEEEGFKTLDLINERLCDAEGVPYQDLRIRHTIILDDPFPDVPGMRIPSCSPSPSRERLESSRIGELEDIDPTQGLDEEEIEKRIREKEARSQAQILEIIGDIPDADVKPPDNVLFVCKLNPVTSEEDLELIFSRFGKITSCEVIKDHKTGESLSYAFIEFEQESSCEKAYFKMDNVLLDDRRIHVDFSQSVSKMKLNIPQRYRRDFCPCFTLLFILDI
eukprot:Sdes_comp18087_c0_seq1m7511